MNKKIILIGILFFALFLLTQFSSNSEDTTLNFTKIPTGEQFDGCSMFPDGNYGHCCLAHDKDYFFGGNWKLRLKSDTRLMQCVMNQGGAFYKVLGPTMWMGVRIGGAPIFPTSFRWGFGRDRY